MRRRDRERLRRQNETEEQCSIRLNRQTESPQARAICLERMRQKDFIRNSVENEEQRSSQLADLRQCDNVSMRRLSKNKGPVVLFMS